MGVRRAVEMAVSLAAITEPDGRVYTLGPLIHNPAVLHDLERRGIEILPESWGDGNSLKGFEKPPRNTAVIIRAHGVSPETEEKLAVRGFSMYDATCSRVKASQNKARFLAEKGYKIFLAGEENHAEIIGIKGYVIPASECFVVADPCEAGIRADNLYKLEPEAKTALIGQTTISPGEYSAIGREIKRFFPGLEIVNTICNATAARQEALRELCTAADALIIVGGKNSANTRRLLSLALEMGKPAWLAEKIEDIPSEIGNLKTVGLSAGASTPDSLIDEIEAALKDYCAIGRT